MIFALILSACQGDTINSTSDSVGNNADLTCSSSEALTIASDFEAQDDRSFTWAVDTAFTADGGTVGALDGPSLDVTCPPCGVSALYAFRVTYSDKSDGSGPWAYAAVTFVCD